MYNAIYNALIFFIVKGDSIMITALVIMIILIVILAFIYAIGVTVLPFIGIIWIIMALIRCNKCNKLVPSKMLCPNCNSTNVKIRSIQTGTSTNTRHSGVGAILGLGFGTVSAKGNTIFNYQREGVCQDCGFNYAYITQEDIDKAKSSAKNKLILSLIFTIIAIFIMRAAYSSVDLPTSIDNSSTSSVVESKSIWANKLTPIDDFDYYIDGDCIYLKEYNGSSKKVAIAPFYEINGKKYYVTEFADAVFVFKTVTSIIIPDGVTYMPANTFNCCAATHIYLPSTLDPDRIEWYFWNYFHGVKEINFGGTEEQWAALVKDTPRSDIDVSIINYNVKIDDLY